MPNTKEDFIVRHRLAIIVVLLILFIGSWIWLFYNQRASKNDTQQLLILDAKIKELENKINNLSTQNQSLVAGVTDDSTNEQNSNNPAKININIANSDELQTLPGIGPAKSADIIAYREQNGDFSSVDDLIHIKGIGEATLEKLRDYIIVD